MKYKIVMKCNSCEAVIDESELMSAEKLLSNHYITCSKYRIFGGKCPNGCTRKIGDYDRGKKATYKNEKCKEADIEEIEQEWVNHLRSVFGDK